MRQTRWEPFSPVWNQVRLLQSERNRLLDRWTDGNGIRGLTTGHPPVNVWEDADHVFVEAELPGLNSDDLEIQVTGGNQLTLKGERKPAAPDKGVVHRQERGFGVFARVLTLPNEVDADKVEATFANGVLLLRLAKREAAKPRKIQVKGA